MTTQFQFGLVVRGQAEENEDISRRFQETLAFVRLADRLGFDSITKTAHYSAYPFQMLQLVPMLARFAAEAPRLRLNAGVLLLPLLSPLHVAEVAGRIGLSLPTLGRRLRAAGTNWRALLDEHRLGNAERMLRETSRSVADVALAVGYAESASFSRAFTRHFARSPRASRV